MSSEIKRDSWPIAFWIEPGSEKDIEFQEINRKAKQTQEDPQ